MKRAKLLLLLSALFCLGLNSCKEKEQIDTAYTIGITNYKYSGQKNDLTLIQNYIVSNGCKLNDVRIYTGESLKDCDRQAIADFEKITAKMSRQDIIDLGVISDFTFAISRPEPKSEKIVNVAEWKFSAN